MQTIRLRYTLAEKFDSKKDQYKIIIIFLLALFSRCHQRRRRKKSWKIEDLEIGATRLRWGRRSKPFAKGEGDTFSIITFADAGSDKSSRYIAR